MATEAGISAVDVWTLALAGAAALLSLASALVTGHLTRKYSDRAWLREQRTARVSEYFDAVNEFMRYLGNDVFRAIGAGKFTDVIRAELRTRQETVHSATHRMFIVADLELVKHATAYQSWMDSGIQGIPQPGAPADPLLAGHPLVQSANAGGELFLALFNPIRRAMEVKGEIPLVSNPTPNTYGR